MALKNSDEIKISITRSEAKLIRDCLENYGYKNADSKIKKIKEKARWALYLGDFFKAVGRRGKKEW